MMSGTSRRCRPLTALDVDSRHADSSSVPAQIFDLDGALLAEAAAPTTRDAAVPAEADGMELLLQGRDLPGFGPTSVPTLTRLGRTPGAPEPEGGRPVGDQGDQGDLDDAPSGSALSSLDAVALFGEAARDRFTARG